MQNERIMDSCPVLFRRVGSRMYLMNNVISIAAQRSVAVVSLILQGVLRSIRAIYFVCLTVLMAQTPADAGNVIPQVSIGGSGYYYRTVQDACQGVVNRGIRVPSNWENQYTSYMGTDIQSNVNNTMLNSVVPYNTVNLAGWYCRGEYQYTNPSTGVESIVYQWGVWLYPVCPASYVPGTYPIGGGATYCPAVPMYYVAAKPKRLNAENGSCEDGPPKSYCGDPINPANANMFKVETDFAANSQSGLQFRRYYNSSDDGYSGFVTGWRGSYSRSISPITQAVEIAPLSGAGMTSSLYDNETSACVSGFAQIRPQISSWTGAAASYGSGVCNLTKDGVSIGTLQVYSTYDAYMASEPAPIGYRFIGDDGHTISFPVVGGVIVQPPASELKLTKTVTGFTLVDGANNTEQYDDDGKLLSITMSAGIVLTMTYNGEGRLASITDSFGNSISLTYDTFGRISSVTRQ